jgi:hypothetical protein
MAPPTTCQVSAILAMPDVIAKFSKMGMELAPQTPAEFDRYVAGIEPN